MEQPGKLIVFEGPDGVGKTTLVQNTVSLLEDLSIPFISLSFPGKTPGTLGFVVDQIHHIPKQFQLDSIEPLALQALHVAAHLDTIETKIRPAIHRGLVVVLDRIWWSTWVYGRAAGVNETVLAKLIEAEQLFWAEVLPAVTFLIQRASAFRAEQSQQAFEKLSSLYEELANRQEETHHVVRISNNDLRISQDKVKESITAILNRSIIG